MPKKYRKRSLIGVVRRYQKGKASLTWLQGMAAFLRNKKGLTEKEIKQVLRYMDAEDLTEEELRDIHQGIMEIESGKAKHFKSMRETIEWLHRKREGRNFTEIRTEKEAMPLVTYHGAREKH